MDSIKSLKMDQSTHSAFESLCMTNLGQEGINSPNQFLQRDIYQLQRITSIPLKELNEIKDTLLHRILPDPVDFSNIHRTVYPTRLKSLNDLLGGGFFAGTVNEILGFTASGKSFLAHTVALQLVADHDLKALIITSDFNSDRESLKTILRQQEELDEDTISYLMQNIKGQSYSTPLELCNILKFLFKPSHSLLETHKILFLDGLSSHFLLRYMQEDDTFSEQIYSTVLQLLRRLSNEHNYLILITNLIMERNEVANDRPINVPNYSEITDPDWAKSMHQRLLLTRFAAHRDDHCYFEVEVKIHKSRYLKSGRSCSLIATERGLE